MRRGLHIRVLSLAAVAATLVVQLWLPAVHGREAPGPCASGAVQACGPQLGDPTQPGPAHDPALCVLCLALHQGRLGLGSGLLVDGPLVVSRAGAPVADAHPVSPRPPELSCAAPRAPPLRSL